MPIVESERLPKEAAGPGLTSTLLPRNLEEETQHEENYENLTGQARQTTIEIGNSLAGPDRRRAGLESPRPGRAWARDFENITRWAGRELGQAPSARLGSRF